MHRRKSWNVTGVSEVIGTILILAMTVVLFASIILWVSTFPTPAASVRLDMAGVEIPVYDSAGNWKGVNVTVDHKGGEALPGFRTLLFFQVNHLGTTKVVSLKTRGTELGVPYGINGPDTTWDTGETWYYSNNSVQAVDKITITVIDSVRSLILWNQLLQGAAGARPPLFLEKWADRLPQTPTIDILQTGQTFSVFTKVTDPDGDLRKNSVYVYFAFLYGTPGNRPPARMYDDGTNGDLVANDGTFSLAATWFKPTDLTWDGGVVIFNATDAQNHKSTSRMTLSVEPGPTQGSKPKGFGSGRPPNLNYNGLQGFNIFNGTEWDSNGFNATETRKFRESENVVVVVGSAILKDLFGKNTFLLYDPFSGAPLTPVVYGSNKQVTTSSIPSSTNAFDFFNYSNGYNIWIYRFDLNNVSTVGINFAKTPTRPPQYFFGAYPLDIDLIDFLGNRFATSDTITITANDGTVRNYPVLSTYRTSAYTQATTSFNSTDVVYVQIVMKTVDATANTVFLGNTVIQDFFGGYQVFKSPTSGPPQHANPPICPVTGTCTYNTGTVITINNAKIAYRYAVNLTLANQDPWVDGTQHYALRVLSMADSDESYSLVLSSQLLITAPLYRMDMVIGLDDASNPAWGSHDINFYFLNVNGVDKWIQNRIEPPYPKAVVRTTTIRMLDFNNDGRLDVVSSVVTGTPAPPPAGDYINLYRQDADQGGGILWTRSNLDFLDTRTVTDIRPALLNKDTAPEIVCAADDGQVWYYLNDGTWTTPGQTATKVIIDTSRTTHVFALDVGDFNGDGAIDVAVARSGGKVTYYINNGNGGGWTATDITLPGDATNVVGLDAGDYNSDGYTDVFVGTEGGRIFRLTGSSGGLQVPGGALATGVGTIVDLKLGNVTGAAGLREVAVAVGNVVKVYSANTGTLLSTTAAAPNPITALGMGDADGNLHDDLMVGTNSGDLVYYRWIPSGWQTIAIFNGLNGVQITTQVNALDLGDLSKAQYVGR